MLINKNTNIERIIAKVDNDFNPDNSDWIPRVAAWCIEAMQMLEVLPKERVKKTLSVKDRIAYSPCQLNGTIKVYTINGCEAKAVNSIKTNCCNSPSTGETTQCESAKAAGTIGHVYQNVEHSDIGSIAETINDKDWPGRYNVGNRKIAKYNVNDLNFTIIGNDKIELGFDAKEIIVEYDSVITECSSEYGCELPVIPDNGLLIEAIGYYVMYKMLCRGYKHPVFNLQASQYGTNPFYQWTQLKDEAKRSILNGNIDEDSSHLFRSNFFINTFDSRHDS